MFMGIVDLIRVALELVQVLSRVALTDLVKVRPSWPWSPAPGAVVRLVNIGPRLGLVLGSPWTAPGDRGKNLHCSPVAAF